MDSNPLFRTVLTRIGPDAADLIGDGILILFDQSAPPELAEVSVLHDRTGDVGRAPLRGDWLHIGGEAVRITAVGESAWQKVLDLGHVVFSFNGAGAASRPGEICVDAVEPGRLLPLLVPGALLEVRAGDAAP